jgi:FKBP-type peptidyl-prolyl cis-trans isomerase
MHRHLSLVLAALALGACSQQPEPAATAAAEPVAAPAAAAPASCAPTLEPVVATTVAQPVPAPADVAQPPADVTCTPSGLMYKVLIAGTGTAHPAATNIVEVHYSGWTRDGAMFDSSRTRGQTAEFPLDRVIPGWTEGVQTMVVGEHKRFWIPGELAYANSTREGVPKGLLVFDVELVAIK